MKKLNKLLLKVNIEKAAQYDFLNNKVFGSAYWVFQKNEEVYKNCFGNISLDTDVPVTENTIFRIASMSKPIAAIAALILIDRGLLSLSDPISKYIPGFKDIHITVPNNSNLIKDLGKAEKAVTVCNLLTHTSGIGSEELKSALMTSDDKLSVDNTVNFFAKSGLDFEPGSNQLYSPFGAFDVLVKIIEIISKTDYLSFLKREIFEPCGMVDTTFVPSAEQWRRMIDMHNKIDGKNTSVKMPNNCVFEDFPCSHYLGGAGLASTLSDYSKFAKMLLNKGNTSDIQIISEKTFNLLSVPYVTEDIMPGSERWGLGVRVIIDEEYRNLSKGSFGWSGAYGTHFWVDPENEIAAVFLKNSKFDGGAANESARNFEKAVASSFI